MSFVPASLIDEIVCANNIIDVVSSHVNVKKSGSGYIALCPFHKEKTPSFHVNEEKQLFYCFGCGVGGNVIDFVRKIDGLDFLDALKLLADLKNIPLDNNYSDGQQQQKHAIYDINKKAARFFFDCLTQNHDAISYLNGRNITQATIRKFGIGFAKNSFEALIKALKVDSELLFQAGLVSRNERGVLYDRFRNRIIFPIIDTRNNVIGFGGRIMDDSKPKYLNSPKTPVFDKGNSLFSLNFAKNCKDRVLLLVEGYMDVCSLYQHGIKNAVATLGTALTEAQAKLIDRYSDTVYLCYDQDQAGQNATQRALDVFASTNVKVLIPEFNNAKDPDEFVQKFGPELFIKALESAKSPVAFKLSKIRKQEGLDESPKADVNKSIDFLNAASLILADVDNPIEREIHLNKLSEETGIAKEVISAQVKRLQIRNKTRGEIETNNVLKAPKEGSFLPKTPETAYKAEDFLLKIILEDREAFLLLRDKLSNGFFATPLYNQVIELIYNEALEPQALLCKLEDQQRPHIARVLSLPTSYQNSMQAATDAMAKIENKRRKLSNAGTDDILELNRMFLRSKRKEG